MKALDDFYSKCKQLQNEMSQQINDLLFGDDLGECFKNIEEKPINKNFGLFPISDYLPYEYYDPEAQLYALKGGAGFLLSMPPMVGASDTDADGLQSLLQNSLPIGASCQVILHASQNIGYFCDDYILQRKNAHLVAQRNSNLRAKFLKSAASHSVLKSHNYVLRDFKLFFSVVFDDAIHDLKLIKHCKETVFTLLKSLNSHVDYVYPTEFLKLIDELLRPNGSVYNRDLIWEPLQTLSQQLNDSQYQRKITNQRVGCTNNDREIITYNVDKFPKNPMRLFQMQHAIGNIFSNQQRIACPFTLSFIFHVVDQHDITKGIEAKANAAEKRAIQLGKFSPSAIEDAMLWRRIVAENEHNHRIVTACFQVNLYARHHEVMQQESQLYNIFNSLNWKLIRNNTLHMPAILAHLPLAQNKNLFNDLQSLGLTHKLWAANCANMLPMLAEMKGGNKKRLIMGGRCGQIFSWDPFENNHGNYNVTITGGSGSGKSVLQQEIALSHLATSGKVRIIDIGRSYEKLSQILDGEFIVFSEKMDLILNPFSNVREDEVAELFSFMVPFLAAMAEPNQKTDGVQNALLEKALKTVWLAKGNRAGIGDIAIELERLDDTRAKDLSLMLSPYGFDGQYGKYFNGKSNVDLRNSLVIFELEEIKDNDRIKNLVFMLLMFNITQEMELGDRKVQITLMVDEAWDMLGGGYGAKIVESIARRARKYGGNLITGTQGISDYFQNNAALAAWNNSYWQIFMEQDKSSITQATKDNRIQLNDYQIKLMQDLTTEHGEYSELMIMGKHGEYAVGRLLLDNYSKILYSTKAEDYAAVNSLLKSGISIDEAIEQVAKDRFGDIYEQ